MADIIVKTFDQGADPMFRDGDIISAFSDRGRRAALARDAWSEHALTGTPVGARHASGTWLGSGLHEEIKRVFHRGVARTVSKSEVEYSLDGFDPYVVGAKPIEDPRHPGRMIHIKLGPFLIARRESGAHLFTDPLTGELRWYVDEMAPVLAPVAEVDALWQKLGSGHGWQHGDHVCPDVMPWSEMSTRTCLALYVEDFAETQEVDWTTPETDDDDETVRIRQHSIDWRNLDGMTAELIADVLDLAKPFDHRRDSQTLELKPPYPVDTVALKSAVAMER